MKEMPKSYALPEVEGLVSELNTLGLVIAHSLYFFVVAAVLIYLIQKAARKWLFPRLASKRFAVVLILALHALVLVATVLLVLGQLGFDVSIIAPVSVLSVIILAVIIFFVAPLLPSLPFLLGDMVEIDGEMGNVRAITPMFTRVQTFDGKAVFIPNAMVWAKKIVNYHTTPNRRIELQLNVSADHSIDEARAVLMGIMGSEERVLADPPPAVRINAARAEGIEILGLCWVLNADFLGARSDLYEKVIKAVQSDAGISLALDRQVVELAGDRTVGERV